MISAFNSLRVHHHSRFDISIASVSESALTEGEASPPRFERPEFWPERTRAIHCLVFLTNMLRIKGSVTTSRSTRPFAAPRSSSRSSVVRPVAFFDKLGSIFKPGQSPKQIKKVVRPTIIPEPSFNLPISLIGIGALEIGLADAPIIGSFTALLGLFLTIQATRVRFVFDDEGLEVVVGSTNPSQTENAFVGGQNRWSYDSFVNWEFWWPGFPCLVYFKETQTRPEGQIHFFPIIFEGKELYEVMVERCGSSKGSSPAARKAAAQYELDTYQTPDERDE